MRQRVTGIQDELFELADKIEELKDVFLPYQSERDLPPAVYHRLDGILR